MSLDEKPTEIQRVTPPTSPTSISTTRNNSQIETGDVEKALAVHHDEDVVTEVAQPRDPNIVDWDGPDDKENPLNWPAREKWMNVGLLAVITLLTLVARRPEETPSIHLLRFPLADEGCSDHLALPCLRRPCLR